MKLRILTQQTNSESCKLLADTLTQKCNYKVYRSPEIKSFHIHIQYGDPRNKIYQYNWLFERDIPVVPFTKDKAKAQLALNEGKTVFARTLINGQDGGGIIVVAPSTPLPDAKIYTLFKESSNEYRVMLFQNKVIDVFEKRHKTSFAANKIRSTGNGYILCRQNVVEPPGLRELAEKVCYINRSDIKGVDICYNNSTNEFFILEVNSAPELGPLMATKLADCILNTYKDELSWN